MKRELKDKESGGGGEGGGENRNEIPAERCEKNSESRRCRKGGSEAFPLRVYCSDGEWVLGPVADVWLCSEGFERLLQHSRIDVIKG